MSKKGMHKDSPVLSSEILTAQKPSGTITRVIRRVSRHFLEGLEIKDKDVA